VISANKFSSPPGLYSFVSFLRTPSSEKMPSLLQLLCISLLFLGLYVHDASAAYGVDIDQADCRKFLFVVQIEKNENKKLISIPRPFG
jgi:hypothetical protein